MRDYLIVAGLIILSYFIGVFIGDLRRKKLDQLECSRCKEVFIDVDPEDIQHVGYTAEQCGYEK